MKILILGLNFAPELVGIGKYTGELASFLAQEGMEVRVVTAFPYYPEWKVQGAYLKWKFQREKFNGVQVFRCPLWVPARPSNLTRLLHLFSFALSSVPVGIGQISWKPDVVLCIVPALFSAPLAVLVARLSGAKAWLHIQDFEVDAAFGLGMLPGKARLKSLVSTVESAILRSFDRVSTISNNMVARAIEKGVSANRVLLFPNWVDTRHLYPLQELSPLRAELGISPGALVVLYHGNMGRKQGLEILLDAAACLKDDRRILFVLSGEGASRRELEMRAAGLLNVLFLNLQPEEKLNALVNLADIHVLPQLSGAADLVMPSKLSSMLASGRPVIACADRDTQIWKVLQEIGRVIPPENVPQLTSSILELADNPEERARLGQLGRAFAEQQLDRAKILNSFRESLLQSVAA